jgi:hypothetical protein
MKKAIMALLLMTFSMVVFSQATCSCDSMVMVKRMKMFDYYEKVFSLKKAKDGKSYFTVLRYIATGKKKVHDNLKVCTTVNDIKVLYECRKSDKGYTDTVVLMDPDGGFIEFSNSDDICKAIVYSREMIATDEAVKRIENQLVLVTAQK